MVRQRLAWADREAPPSSPVDSGSVFCRPRCRCSWRPVEQALIGKAALHGGSPLARRRGDARLQRAAHAARRPADRWPTRFPTHRRRRASSSRRVPLVVAGRDRRTDLRSRDGRVGSARRRRGMAVARPSANRRRPISNLVIERWQLRAGRNCWRPLGTACWSSDSKPSGQTNLIGGTFALAGRTGVAGGGGRDHRSAPGDDRRRERARPAGPGAGGGTRCDVGGEPPDAGAGSGRRVGVLEEDVPHQPVDQVHQPDSEGPRRPARASGSASAPGRRRDRSRPCHSSGRCRRTCQASARPARRGSRSPGPCDHTGSAASPRPRPGSGSARPRGTGTPLPSRPASSRRLARAAPPAGRTRGDRRDRSPPACGSDSHQSVESTAITAGVSGETRTGPQPCSRKNPESVSPRCRTSSAEGRCTANRPASHSA